MAREEKYVITLTQSQRDMVLNGLMALHNAYVSKTGPDSDLIKLTKKIVNTRPRRETRNRDERG